MRRLILLLSVFATFSISYAQNEQQQINAIKSNIDFLYATGISSASGEEASDNAKDLLALEIEQWLKENNTDDIAGYVAKSKETASQISTRRGNLYRVFVYVKKQDVLPYYKEEEVMVVDFVEPQTQTENSDANKEDASAAADNSASEKTDNSTPVIGNSVSTDTAKLDLGRQDTKVEESPLYAPTAQEKAMTEIASFTELNEFVNRGRRDGCITAVGKYSDMPKIGTVYVFIHNRMGEIPACMKVTDGTAVNLSTGNEDTISDYKGCGAIWIKINND